MLQTIGSFVTACAVSLAIGAMPAQAEIINWTLQDVVFSDGGAASGTFATDSTTGDVVSFAITTTAGTKLGGTSYDTSVAQVYDNKWGPDSFDLTDEAAHVYLELAFVDPLTAAGTDLLALHNASYECDNCYPARVAVSGEAVASGPTAMPEPAPAVLLFTGLFGLAFVRSYSARPRHRSAGEA